jgi:hypothetical protein
LANSLCPISAARDEPHGALLGFGGALDLDLQPRLGKLLYLARPPFDDGHCVVGRDVEIEIVDLVQRAEPLRVDVHERDRTTMHSCDDEGRRHHVALHSQTGADALHERGLACAERSVEHDEIAGAEDCREAAPECAGVGGGGQFDHRSA